MRNVLPPARLDSFDRCCGTKPLPYKTPPPYRVCLRCGRHYEFDGRAQIKDPSSVSQWIEVDGGYVARWQERDYAKLDGSAETYREVKKVARAEGRFI